MISESTLLTLVGLVGSGGSLLLVYFLKSRCTDIECCCMKCKREVIKEVRPNLVDSTVV